MSVTFLKRYRCFFVYSPRSSTAEHSAVEKSPTDWVLTLDDCGSASLSPKGRWFKSGRGDGTLWCNPPRWFYIRVRPSWDLCPSLTTKNALKARKKTSCQILP